MNQFNASAWALEHKSFVGFLMVLLAVEDARPRLGATAAGNRLGASPFRHFWPSTKPSRLPFSDSLCY